MMRATYADRTTDRRAHTRSAGSATCENDSAAHPGTEGQLATVYTRAPDPPVHRIRCLGPLDAHLRS
jgi:hypothetical protein